MLLMVAVGPAGPICNARMVQIQRGALLADNTERLAQFALAQVVFQGERMSIPDLDGIAKLLDKSL